MKEEPNPNRFKKIQNYINALKNHWAHHGGPANQNRAIALRLRQYWNEKHENKKNLANRVKNLQNKFHENAEQVGKRPNSNNSNSNNSYASPAIPTFNTNALKNLANKIKEESGKYRNTSNRLNQITHAIKTRKLVPNKYMESRGTWHTHRYLKRYGIRSAKEKIRKDYSLGTMNRALASLSPLPQNVINMIKKKANVPTLPVTRTKSRVYHRPGHLPLNLYIYTNRNGRFFFMNKQGRWYLMNSPTQRWAWNYTEKKYKPYRGRNM